MPSTGQGALKNHDEAKRAVVRVGDGRGFVVEAGGDRIIITAAHCLPNFPPCASFSYTEERTYADLVGKIGTTPTVWAECYFADPIGDIAVRWPNGPFWITNAENIAGG